MDVGTLVGNRIHVGNQIQLGLKLESHPHCDLGVNNQIRLLLGQGKNITKTGHSWQYAHLGNTPINTD